MAYNVLGHLIKVGRSFGIRALNRRAFQPRVVGRNQIGKA